MDITETVQSLKERCELVSYLGIEFVPTAKDDVCVARMPVDKRNLQPFGALSGGATLALAETLAGAASVSLCGGGRCAGLNISCNHVHPAEEGDVVTATAKLLHRGHQTHLWQVEVYNQNGILISQVMVTNFVLEQK